MAGRGSLAFMVTQKNDCCRKVFRYAYGRSIRGLKVPGDY